MDNPIIAFSEIREKEGFSVQEKQAMFYQRNPNYSLFFIDPTHHNYRDFISNEGNRIEYMGHNTKGNVKSDQSTKNPDNSLNENGLFVEAVFRYLTGVQQPEKIKVYYKVSANWNCECLGFYDLIGCKKEYLVDKKTGSQRQVFKFLLTKTS